MRLSFIFFSHSESEAFIFATIGSLPLHLWRFSSQSEGLIVIPVAVLSLESEGTEQMIVLPFFPLRSVKLTVKFVSNFVSINSVCVQICVRKPDANLTIICKYM